MTVVEHSRVGTGPPLLLVHGIGSRRECWAPVVPLLAPHRHVVTVDLPGFGRTPMRPGQDMSPIGLARSLAEFLADIGVERPHVAGNSLGGWIALELARLGAVASATGLSPAGLWRTPAPLYMRSQVRAMRYIPTALGERGVGVVTAIPPLRIAAVSNIFGRAWRLSRPELLAETLAMRRCTGFEPVLYAAEHRRFVGGMVIDVPVTIAFGRRDVIFGEACRLREELPAQTRWVDPPRGWGHLPTWDDPRGVADLLLAGSAASVGAIRGAAAG